MKSLYEQVYESLKNEIISEKYQVGERVPSENELSDSFQVSRITSKKALEKLVDDGYVYRQRGRGTFVAEFRNSKKEKINRFNSDKPLFGLIVTNFDDSFGSGLITSLEEASSGKCFIILKCSLGNSEREEKIVKELLDFGVDGLVVFPAQAEHYSSEILKMVVDKFPLVLIDRSFKGLATSSVSTDNEEAAKRGINHLFDLGHEQIGVLMPHHFETTTIEDRLNGIVEAYSERQLIVNRDLWTSNIKSTLPTPIASKAEDLKTIKEHINNNRQMTALFALEYNIAVLAKKAIEQLGLKVPEDISVICFDSPPWDEIDWKYTHIQQNEKEIGKLTIERLLNMYNGEFEINKDRIRANLIEGNTTQLVKAKLPN